MKDETWRTFLALGLFLLSTIWQVVVQQKTVDAAKLLYPEKRGSIYSSKFNKEWLQSCDERERAEIYHCGYTGYKFGIYACLILFVVTAIGAGPLRVRAGAVGGSPAHLALHDAGLSQRKRSGAAKRRNEGFT